MQPPEKENPPTAKTYDETDPDNRPLDREERRALREQDRLMEKRRRARQTREARRAHRAHRAREEKPGPGTSGT